LLGALIHGGVKVTQFRELQTDLEEAFMSFAKPGENRPPVAPSVSIAADTVVMQGSKR
jgi:hypothetical protein